MKFRKEQFIHHRVSKETGLSSFQVVIRIPDRDTITKTFSEKKYGSARSAFDNAIRFRNETLANAQKGLFLTNSDRTLEDVFYESFDVYVASESTKRKMMYHLKKYVMNLNVPIIKVTKAMVIASLNSMVLTCSDNTIMKVLTIWRRIANTALVKEYISYDFTAGIKAPKSKAIPTLEKKDVIATREMVECVQQEIRKTFNEVEADSVCTALDVMWYTGMRPAEVFSLKKSQVRNGYIYVTEELGSGIADTSKEVDEFNMNVVRRPKTEASVRAIPISPKLQAILDRHDVDSDILFPNIYGDYFNLTNLASRIRLLKLPFHFNMYMLRHTVATNLVTKGVDQRTVIEILGHESFGMSVYYARSNDELKRSLLDSM